MTDNYTPIFNEVLEALCKINLSPYETRVLMAIWRKTYGFIDKKTGERKKIDYIATSQIAEMCNLDKRHVSRALKGLKDKKVISRDDKKTGFSKEFMKLMSSVEGIPPVEMTDKVNRVPVEMTEGASRGDTPSPVEALQIESIKRNTKEIITNVITGFGNPEINEVSSYFLKVFQIPKEDCSQKESRRYWYLLLNESKQGAFGVKWLIDVARQDDYYKNNITSSKDLYYKRVKLLARKRGTSPKTAFFKEEI